MAETINVQIQPDINAMSAQLRDSMGQAFATMNNSLKQTGNQLISVLNALQNNAVATLKAMAKAISGIQMPQLPSSSDGGSLSMGGAMGDGNSPPGFNSMLDSVNKLKGAFSEFKSGFGIFDELKNKLTGLPGNFDSLASKINEMPISFGTLKSAFSGITSKFGEMKGSFSGLKDGFSGIGPTISGFASSVGGSLSGLFTAVKANPLGAFLTVLQLLIPIFTDLYNNNEGFRELIDGIVACIAEKVVPIIDTVAKFLSDFWENCLSILVTCLMEFWQNVLIPLGMWIGEVLMGVLGVLIGIGMDLFNNVIMPIAQFLGDVFTVVLKTVMDIWEKWQPVIQTVWDFLVAIWENVLKPIASFLIEGLGNAFEALSGIVDFVIKFIVGIFNGFFSFVSGIWDGLMNILSGVIGFLTDIFMGVWSTVFETIGNIVGGMATTITEIFASVKKIFSGIIDFITGVFSGDWSKAWEGVKKIFSGIFDGVAAILKAPINTVIDIINGAIKCFNKISFDLPDWLGGGHFGINIPLIKKLATGGIINQPTLAMVGEAGREAVMPLEHNTGWISNLADDINHRMGTQGTAKMEKLLAQLIIEVRSLDLNIDGKKAGKLIHNARKELSMIR